MVFTRLFYLVQALDKITLTGWKKFSCYILVICYLCIPVSSSVEIGAFQLNLPIEPLLGISAILLFYTIDIKTLVLSSFIRHPLTLLALLYHLCMMISITYSTDYVVSAKYALVNSLHFWVFYFGIYYLAIHQVDFRKLLHAYIISFSFIICYSFLRYGAFNFGDGVAPELARPFYSDHTLFGASLAFLFPLLFLKDIGFKKSKTWRPLLILFYLLAIIIIYSQAVWLSLILGLITYQGIKKYKSNSQVIIYLSVIFVLISSILLFTIYKINTQSTDRYSIFTSIGKKIVPGKLIKDVSTLERINRYSCAIRMWRDRPLFGFGAGTFQFAYLPYQLPSDMTRISVTTARALDGKPHSSGKGGGAHSEYFQAFVELGLIGGITWLLFVIFTIHYSLKIYYSTSPADRFILAIFIALLGYFIHALFNNLLHNEEVSFLFWSMIGWVVYSDSGSEIKNK